MNYILLRPVEARDGSVGVYIESLGVCIESVGYFRYQPVGIGSATCLHWGSYQTRGPNVNGFAFWWNIGLAKRPNWLINGSGSLPVLIQSGCSTLQGNL